MRPSAARRDAPRPELGPWVSIHSFPALDVALTLARGKNQRQLLLGWETYSGSEAKRRGIGSTFRKLYRQGHNNLLKRLTEAGVEWSLEDVGTRTIVKTPFQEKILHIDGLRCVRHEDCLAYPELARACAAYSYCPPRVSKRKKPRGWL